MFRKVVILFLVNLVFVSISTKVVLADRGAGDSCGSSYPTNPKEPCIKDYDCVLESPITKSYSCKYSPVSATFGKITLPDALKKLMGTTDPTGAAGIGKFLSNLIALFYSLATIVLIFMLLWGAFEWMTSGGDKEAVGKARGRIINALIGIMLFAVAFAVIQVLGIFTGFEFFV